jgi:pimeloyl-ACP methyl ester carboxylesterase
MARITISGLEIDYELLGKPGAPAVALTPGGRFPKEIPGLPELGKALADGGHRVLLWDRPNCGASDLCFDGNNESEIHAHTLSGLIRALDLGPTALVAGSAGARVSLMTAVRDPEIVSHLAMWWISGGATGLMLLASVYCCTSAFVAGAGGMAAVAELPEWKEQLQRNLRNRDILLSQDPERFIETMDRWAAFYIPSEITPVPGMSPEAFAGIHVPTLIFRSARKDVNHPRKTTDWVHRLIPHSKLVAPPWSDDEWHERAFSPKSKGIFTGWPAVAPRVLDFLKSK